MKRSDTIPDARPHDIDPTSDARDADTTDPGAPPEEAGVDDVLDGFGGRPRTYFAKHQAASNGRNAAKYDAVGVPMRAHTDPAEMAPVILATTAEEPQSRILQEASRSEEARATVRLVRGNGSPRAESTVPRVPTTRSTAGWLVPALAACALVIGGALYLTRPPARAGSAASDVPVAAATVPSTAVQPTATVAPAPTEPTSVRPAAPSPSASSLAPPPAPAPAPAPAPSPPSSSSAARPARSVRAPDAIPSPAAPAASPPRGDIKWTFE